jgi:hypothetical protein
VNPADELRTAADRLRKLTAAIHAPDLPHQAWHTEECADDEQGNCPCIVAQGQHGDWDAPPTPLYYVADAETPEVAAYIAAMGPNVGTLLADWLASWDGVDFDEHASMPDDLQRALAIARQINANTSSKEGS